MWELLEDRLIERGRGLRASRLLTQGPTWWHSVTGYGVWIGNGSTQKWRVDHEVTMPRLNWFFFILVCMGNFDERILSLSSWQEVPSRVALVRLDRKRLLVAARHTPRGVVWMEMSQLLGLSYQVILPSKRRRILLANCPQEAECVNSQVMPCNAVPSGWPLYQCSGTLRGMLQSSLLVCCRQLPFSEQWTLCSILLLHVCVMFVYSVCYFPCVCCTCTVVLLVGLYQWTLNLELLNQIIFTLASFFVYRVSLREASSAHAYI